jgi:hypothetical protein
MPFSSIVEKYRTVIKKQEFSDESIRKKLRRADAKTLDEIYQTNSDKITIGSQDNQSATPD